ncbi:RDD family protein [Microbacterium sp. A588]
MTMPGEREAAAPTSIWEIDDKPEQIEGLDAEGRPDPAYAASLGLLRAPFGRRALAFVCDVGFWTIAQLPLWLGAVPLLLKLATGSISPYGFINHPSFVLAIVMTAATVGITLALSIVQLALHGRRGLTIGKSIVGIRSINVKTLERPGIGAVLLRYLIVGASGIVPLLGPVLFLGSPTFDPDGRGRGLHDRATGVWLVDVRRGLNPYDDKRMRVARKVVTAEPAPERSALPSLATPRDPAAQPEYRPGTRTSAGVIGMARTHTTPEPGPQAQPQPAPTPAPAPQPQPARQPTPAPAPASAVPNPSRFALRLDTGERISVSAAILLGRNPDAAEHPGAHPIPLPDDSKSISKTHLLVRPVDIGLEIIDCYSTNGSGLIRDGVEYALTPGTPVVTVPGDTIRFGDRIAVVLNGTEEQS